MEKKGKSGEILQSLVTEEMLSIVTDKIRVIAVEQVEMAKQYFKAADHHKCSSKN